MPPPTLGSGTGDGGEVTPAPWWEPLTAQSREALWPLIAAVAFPSLCHDFCPTHAGTHSYNVPFFKLSKSPSSSSSPAYHPARQGQSTIFHSSSLDETGVPSGAVCNTEYRYSAFLQLIFFSWYSFAVLGNYRQCLILLLWLFQLSELLHFFRLLSR